MLPFTRPSDGTDVKVFALSDTTGLTEWVDYIPVQAVDLVADQINIASPTGFTQVNALSASDGLVAFTDYIPVSVYTDRTERWSTGASGYIPVYAATGSLGASGEPAAFSSVIFQSEFEGADEQATARDDSVYNSDITLTNSRIDDAQAKVGSTSLRVGSGKTSADARNARWDIGAEDDFTVECWTYWGSDPGTSDQAFMSGAWHQPNNENWLFHLNANELKFDLGSGNGGTATATHAETWNPVGGQWYHVAAVMVRDPAGTDTMTMYVDGTALGTSTVFDGLASNTDATVNFGPTIGSWWNGTIVHTGWLDRLRFTKEALYTADFTPPTDPMRIGDGDGSDAYYAAVDLLLPFDGSNNDTTTTDASQNTHTVSMDAGVAPSAAIISTAASKFGGSSVYLDGVNDYVSIDDDATLRLGNNDFCIENWVNFDATVQNGVFCSKWFGGTGTKEWIFGRRTDGAIYFSYSTNGTNAVDLLAHSWTPTADTWYHVAAIRDGTTVYLMIDGVQVATGNIGSATIHGNTSPFAVGCFFANNTVAQEPFLGWIDDLRITNGNYRYNFNGFDVPTAAHPLS